MASTVTAAEVSKNFGAYQDAAVREPVVITKNGRPRTVLMAYEDFVRLSKRDRRVQRTVDLTDEDIAVVSEQLGRPARDVVGIAALMLFVYCIGAMIGPITADEIAERLLRAGV